MQLLRRLIHDFNSVLSKGSIFSSTNGAIFVLGSWLFIYIVPRVICWKLLKYVSLSTHIPKLSKFLFFLYCSISIMFWSSFPNTNVSNSFHLLSEPVNASWNTLSKSSGLRRKRIIQDALLLTRAGIIVYFYVTIMILTVPFATKWRLLNISYAK